MSNTGKENIMYRKLSKKEKEAIIRPEKGFKLPLKTIIEWKDTSGKSMTEHSVLSYISQNGSSFNMRAPVLLGQELKLAIDLPEGLSDGDDLKMIIKGKVVFVETSLEDSTLQKVTLKFKNQYIIKP